MAPIVAIVTAAVRQFVGKPFSNYVKVKVKTHPGLRGVVIRFAQALHRSQTRLRLMGSGLGRIEHVTPLNEQMAIEQGADAIGEIVIYGVTVASVLIPYYMWPSTTDKQIKQLAELNVELGERVQQLEEQVADLRRSPLDRLFGKEKKSSPPSQPPSEPPPSKQATAPSGKEPTTGAIVVPSKTNIAEPPSSSPSSQRSGAPASQPANVPQVQQPSVKTGVIANAIDSVREALFGGSKRSFG